MVLPAQVCIQQNAQKLYTVFTLNPFPSKFNYNWLWYFNTWWMKDHKVGFINIDSMIGDLHPTIF